MVGTSYNLFQWSLLAVAMVSAAAGNVLASTSSGSDASLSAEDCYHRAVELGASENAELMQMEIVHLVQRAADAGYPPALAQMGVFYWKGWGIAQDAAKAADYYIRAANAGVAGAMNNLSVLYYQGEGVPRDVKKAQNLCRDAIALDSSDALVYCNLALYLRSEPQTKAVKLEIEMLLRKAAELGDVASMIALAQDYGDDGGVCAAAPKEAYRYWYKAAMQEEPRAYYDLAECYMKGLGTEVDEQEGLDMMHAAAAAGDARALYKLGRLYENGVLEPANQDKAAEYYMRAIKVGHPVAGAALMRMLLRGYERVELSDETKVQLMERAAEAGVYGCATYLACYFADDSSLDTGAHEKWLKLASERDAEPLACFIRGEEILHNSLATPLEKKEAIRLLEFSSSMGVGPATCALGYLYLTEKGCVMKDLTKVVHYFQLAAEQGEAEGADMLSELYAMGMGVSVNKELSQEWKKKADDVRKQNRIRDAHPHIILPD